MENGNEKGNDQVSEKAETSGNLAETKVSNEELKERNELMAEQLRLQKEMQATNTVSGSADAGQVPKTLTEEQKENAEARKMLEGTGFESMFPEEN